MIKVAIFIVAALVIVASIVISILIRREVKLYKAEKKEHSSKLNSKEEDNS